MILDERIAIADDSENRYFVDVDLEKTDTPLPPSQKNTVFPSFPEIWKFW